MACSPTSSRGIGDGASACQQLERNVSVDRDLVQFHKLGNNHLQAFDQIFDGVRACRESRNVVAGGSAARVRNARLTASRLEVSR